MGVLSSADKLWHGHSSLWHKQFILPLALPATVPHTAFLPFTFGWAFIFTKQDSTDIWMTLFLNMWITIYTSQRWICQPDLTKISEPVVRESSFWQDPCSVCITRSGWKKLSEGLSQTDTWMMFDSFTISKCHWDSPGMTVISENTDDLTTTLNIPVPECHGEGFSWLLWYRYTMFHFFTHTHVHTNTHMNSMLPVSFNSFMWLTFQGLTAGISFYGNLWSYDGCSPSFFFLC